MEGQLVFAGISAFSGDQVRAGGLSEAVAALLGAETEEDAVGLVRLVTGYADSSDERARAIARWLSGLYGSGRLATYPAIVPLEPDLLAEVLVARELTALPELVGGAFDLAVDRQLSRALVVLSRAAAARDDLADVVRAALDERLPGLVHQFASRQIQDAELLTGLRLALQAIRPLAGAVAAMDELPQASTALAPLAVDVTTLAVEGLRNAASHDPDRYLPDLAGALNNLSVGLGGLGRPGDALAAVEEAVGHYRVLAKVNPDRYLPDLAGALNNLSVQLGDLGRQSEAPRRFAEILNEHPNDAWATGVLLLRRAGWYRDRGDLTSAIADALGAAQRLNDGKDAQHRGKARSLLRALRADDPTAFDQAWSQTVHTDQPVWLRHHQHDARLGEQLIDWIRTSTWDDSRALLTAHGDALLTDQAEATLEHLIDDNPGDWQLTQHLAILQVARADGIDAAYDALHQSLVWQALADRLLAWVTMPTWDESRSFLQEHTAELLTDEAESVLHTLVDQNPDSPALLAHLGLLTLCRSDGIEPADGLFGDSNRLRAPVQVLAPGEDLDRTLALARLRAGLQPDEADTHFDHALAALAAGEFQEAEQAITRCADTLQWWERSARMRRLDGLAAARPDLAEGLGRLRAILSSSTSAT